MNRKEKLSYGVIIFVIFSASVFYFTPVRMASVNGTSMEPTISDGDVVIIVPSRSESIRIGDIIAFKPEPDRRVIHRVIALENGKIRTKGDNSEKPDEWIEPSQVVGEHFLTIPNAGTVLNRANPTMGFVLFILAPAALIIYNEVRKIRAEMKNKE